ncbi:MAG: sigma-54-dependent Fis family transcriptional regulator [Acidiferrobacter sp.]
MDERVGSREDLREQEVLFLRETARMLGRGLAPRAALYEILHLLSELMGLNRGRVVLREDDGSGAIRHAYGLKQDEVARGVYGKGEGITGNVLRNGLPIIVQDINREPAYLQRAIPRARLPAGTVSYIAVPLTLEGRTIGVLGAHRLRRRARSLAADLQILNTAAAFIVQIIHLHRLALDHAVRRSPEDREPHFSVIESGGSQSLHGIVGSSDALRAALAKTERIAKSGATALLLGESGTGKELFAHALHLLSERHEGPFVRVNCGAIPESLFESELFGHERGAFTGAHAAAVGRFEQAHGGTLFLDEVADIPLALQVKLLRALQEHTIERLGGHRSIALDVRIVAATNQDLHEAVRAGRFRLDLFYRLNVVPIRLPALRERPDDIPPLVDYHLKELLRTYQREIRISPAAMRRLRNYGWPGNIRQLRNIVERLVLLADTNLIDENEVSQALAGELGAATRENAATGLVRSYEPMGHWETERIRKALAAARGNKSQAARILGLTLRQLTYRLKRLKDVATDC